MDIPSEVVKSRSFERNTGHLNNHIKILFAHFNLETSFVCNVTTKPSRTTSSPQHMEDTEHKEKQVMH